MIEWIEMLEIIAVLLAATSTVFVFVVLVNFARRMFPREKTILIKHKPEKKIKKETEPMSKEAREGVTFNDIFMFMIAVPLVLLWVGFAGFVIHSGLQNAAVLEQIEGYTTLIAILGGPALLIIKDALDVWKQEQAEKTAFYKHKAQSVIDYNASVLAQAQEIESKAQEQAHKMESKK